jgi:hypothetical protein
LLAGREYFFDHFTAPDAHLEAKLYLAVPLWEIKAAIAPGAPAGAFKIASVTRFSRTVVYGEWKSDGFVSKGEFI